MSAAYELITGDALESLSKIDSGSFEAAITSPPYNLRNSSGGFWKREGFRGRWASSALALGYSEHADDMPQEAYVEWQRAVLSELMRVTTDDGAIFYNHKWRVQNGLLQDRADIMAGFPVRQIIIWQRNGGINFNDQYFVPTYEVVYLVAKPKFKLRPKANGHGDVWKIPYERNNPHPAPMPLRLAERIVTSIDAENIIDPFSGSGTTGVAAVRHGRNYTGIEESPEYVAMAENRLSAAMAQPAFDLEGIA